MCGFRIFLWRNIHEARDDIMHYIFLLTSIRLIDERYEQSMEAYEARAKLIRAKWMLNEVKDMVNDKSSRQDVIDFIEQFSEDFEI